MISFGVPAGASTPVSVSASWPGIAGFLPWSARPGVPPPRLTASTASPRNFPALILASAGGNAVKAIWRMPADGGVDRMRSARERHVHHVEAEFLLEQFARQMRRRADAGASETVFARIGLDQRDQFFDAFCRHRRIDHDHVGRIGHHGDRREILDRVIGHMGVQAHIDHEAGAHHGEGVAVGRSPSPLRRWRCCCRRRACPRRRIAGRGTPTVSARRCGR